MTMFISTKEKINLQARVEALEFRADQMVQDLRAVMDKLTTKVETTKVEDKNKLSKARQAKRNAYAKAYYYKKKAEKANSTNQGKI
jgi:hypothetical protein